MTSYEDYNRQRIASNIAYSSEGSKAIDKVVAKKEFKLMKLKHDTAFSKAANKVDSVSSKVGRYLSKKLSNKQFVRDQNKVTVVENQPVYSKDKSRFFKTAWEEEKRQLFFNK